VRVSEFVRLIERSGWYAEVRPGGHMRLTHPLASAPVFCAVSPSDVRWWRNTLTQMRKVLPPAKPAPVAPASTTKPKKAKRRPSPKRVREVRIVHDPVIYHATPPPPTQEPVPYDPSLRRQRIPGAPYGFAKVRW
jgi:hypothetical protein